ncbi:MAG TPA: Fe-S protein assembly co-chaperone HscB [Acidobacteriaceae bacterium]|jgi:molecular chaperone HscB|nr:Fe-S protein assembly co-chaperone HscB [Acidobacteriaceae bacterium]
MSDVSHCWSCGVALDNSPLLCPACNKVQPVSNTDYFQAFGLDRALSLDTIALEREFHRLSRRLHPDRFARATPQEQEWSLAATALLNDAYRTLRGPIQRTEYLLKLEGLEIGEEHAGKGKSADRQPPADLLEEVFDLNMQLEEMRMNRKMGEDDPGLQSDLTTARSRFETLLAAVDTDISTEGEKWDTGGTDARAQATKAMAALLDRRRYLRNLVRDVNEVLAA